jgi:hypothetical protein
MLIKKMKKLKNEKKNLKKFTFGVRELGAQIPIYTWEGKHYTNMGNKDNNNARRTTSRVVLVGT